MVDSYTAASTSRPGGRRTLLAPLPRRPPARSTGPAVGPLYASGVQFALLTVVETYVFRRQWPHYWTEEQLGSFAAYISEHPLAGDVVPESGGLRKVRWGRRGSGKSGGVRVIYFLQTNEGQIVLLTIYARSETDNVTGAKLKEIRRALEE